MIFQSYERRSKFVKKGKETKLWEFVTPDLMPDEEKRDETYVRHQPEYQSEKFNLFLNKLDMRSTKKQTNHSRFKRSIGTPMKKPAPVGVPKWMVKASAEFEVASTADSSSENSESDSDSELI